MKKNIQSIIEVLVSANEQYEIELPSCIMDAIKESQEDYA